MSKTYTFNKLCLKLHKIIGEEWSIHEDYPWQDYERSLELKDNICFEIEAWRDYFVAQEKKKVEQRRANYEA